MVHQFSCLLNARNRGTNPMLKLICFLMMSVTAFGQSQVPAEKIKKDTVALQNAVNDVVGTAVPGFGVLQGAKATYLEGYGFIVTLELALEPPRNPFSFKSADEVRATVTQRRKDTVEKLTNLLKQRTPALESIAPAESATVIVYLLNANPADLPDLPAQLVLSVKKQEAVAGRAVNLREYK
jgi:hypothetical protein